MMKKNKLIYLLLGFVLAFSACDEPGSEILWDLSFLELDAATTASGSNTYTYLRVNDGVNVPSGFQVNLASAPLSQATNVTFEIVAATTTAIENVHYVVNSTSLTIPAGENIATLPIDIIDDGINAGEQLNLDIRLVSADVEIGNGFGQAVHTIQITCISDIAGTFSTSATGDVGDGSGGSAGTYGPITSSVTFTETSTDGIYDVSDLSFGMYAQIYADNTPVTGRLQDVCDALTDLGDTDRFGDPFTVTGTRVAASGVITLTWSNTWGDTGTVTLTPQ
ncbi:MAG: hypothetical protein HEP71_16470 [Roseivirga sp.]|nr:hypothetical protein [Roseivirga sp.]